MAANAPTLTLPESDVMQCPSYRLEKEDDEDQYSQDGMIVLVLNVVLAKNRKPQAKRTAAIAILTKLKFDHRMFVAIQSPMANAIK